MSGGLMFCCGLWSGQWPVSGPAGFGLKCDNMLRTEPYLDIHKDMLGNS